MANVRLKVSFCESHRALEEFSDPNVDNAKVLRMGLGPEMAVTAQEIRIADLVLNMEIFESHGPQGLMLQIHSASFKVEVNNIKFAMEGSVFDIPGVIVPATMEGKEPLNKILQFGAPLKMKPKLGEGGIELKGMAWGALGLVAKMFKSKIEHYVLGEVVLNIFSAIATNMKTVAVDGPLKQALAGRSPYPVKISLTGGSSSDSQLSLRLEQLRIGSEKTAEAEAEESEMGQMGILPDTMGFSLVVGPPEDKSSVAKPVTVRGHVFDPKKGRLKSVVKSKISFDLPKILMNFAAQTNEGVFDIAGGRVSEEEAAASAPKDPKEAEKEAAAHSATPCNDPNKRHISKMDVAVGVGAGAAAVTGVLAAGVGYGTYYLGSSIAGGIGSLFGSKKEVGELPEEKGPEREQAERAVLANWYKHNPDEIGMMSRTDAKTFSVMGMKAIEFAMSGSLKGEVSSGGKTMKTSGKIVISDMKLTGMKYHVLDATKLNDRDENHEFTSNLWHPYLSAADDLTIGLENLSVDAKVEIDDKDEVSACVGIGPMKVNTGSAIENAAMNTVINLKVIQDQVNKALQTIIGDVLKNALTQAGDAVKFIQLDLTLAHTGLDVTVAFQSDWSDLATKLTRAGAVPPQISDEVRFGKGWAALRKYMSDQKDSDALQGVAAEALQGSLEKLPISPYEWLEEGYHQSMDRLIHNLDLNGDVDLDTDGRQPASLTGTFVLNIWDVLKPNVWDVGVFEFGEFKVASEGNVLVEKLKPGKPSGDGKKHEDVEVVLSCGALYILPKESEFLLLKPGTAKKQWLARIDLLPAESGEQPVARESGDWESCKQRHVGKAVAVYRAKDKEDKKDWLVCLKQSAMLSSALTWESTRLLELKRMTETDYSAGSAWTSVALPMKDASYVFKEAAGTTADQLKHLKTECATAIAACGDFFPCQGVSCTGLPAEAFEDFECDCNFLSVRDLDSKKYHAKPVYLYKEWILGSPKSWGQP
eukprot:gnl/TRDRNA2_/TRDRNA2_92613_c0_seq1.p1 gnl/TRDRNA2_/TRDRNA2_92613_c0~~gnl/TRDRNA2_/TRDRNA2_92613_c0_seq1.p1  ORF type:complete len:1096 (+),score=207.05 gnl/TRDRNA2_/TRDRNA2_92613_c0_seq1:334-3288(+)